MLMSTAFLSCPPCGEVDTGEPSRYFCGNNVAAAPRVEVFRNSLLLFISLVACPVWKGKVVELKATAFGVRRRVAAFRSNEKRRLVAALQKLRRFMRGP